MNSYRIGGGGGGKIDIKVVGTGYSAGADHFFGGKPYSFIYSHQITCDFALDIKHHKHVHCLEYGSLFVSQLQTV